MGRQTASNSHLHQRKYDGHVVTYRDDGWFNATQAAAKFGKKPNEWLRLPSTDDYISALCRQLRNEKISLLKAIRQGRDRPDGKWLHPKLAVHFARWLDVDFAVWCDMQIDEIIRGSMDWKLQRHAAASSYKVMSQMLRESRIQDGKGCATHHYMNEAKLVNWVLQGEFCGLDRERLNAQELDLLASLEVQNTLLLARGLDYATRKPLLEQFARDWRVANHPQIKAAA